MAWRALMIREAEGRIVSGLSEMDEDGLDPGEVTIRVAYSDVNYKDALAATGAGKIVRRFPCVGGIDLSGVVIASASPKFSPGETVLATGYDLGVAHHGGYAEIARLPAEWLVKMPAGLDAKSAMAVGTAGFTAALALMRMEHEGLMPGKGPVIVSGATGGVGSVAIEILAKAGYEVHALTGKADAVDYLRHLGAAKVVFRSELDLSRIRPLEKATWAGAIDNLGGDVLAWMASTMKIDGVIASVGLAASMELKTTVAPFILRGVSLLGIDSVNCPMSRREVAWQKLASVWKPEKVIAAAREIDFAELPAVFDDFLKARVTGRIVVRIGQ